MNGGGLGWFVVTVVCPLILVVVMAWAVIRNRQSRVPKEISEAGARRVYKEEEQRRRTGEDGAD